MALLNRRHALGLGIGALSAGIFRPAAADNGGTEMHGMSVFGDLKYPADFKHFDYVNPDAPKGGLFSTIPRPVPIINPSRRSIPSMPSSSRAKARRAWS